MSIQRKFYVTIEFASVGRISITTEDFYVVIELATIESSTAHDRARRAKAGVHDSVALCCVTKEEAMPARQTRRGAHDRPSAHTTEVRT